MRNPHGGDRVDIVLLRSNAWLAAHNGVLGGEVWLSFDEISIDGWAVVDAVEPCPSTASGLGRVITGTITHQNSFIMRITLESGEILNPTNTHRLFSATRHDWVPAVSLFPGEELETQNGAVKVLAVDHLPGTQRVYNLEVESDHRYFVGRQRILAHNVCGPDGGPLPLEVTAKDPRRGYTPAEREALHERAESRCEYCLEEVTLDASHADHMQPHSKGGLTDLDNGANACVRCNTSKGAKVIGRGAGQWWPTGW